MGTRARILGTQAFSMFHLVDAAEAPRLLREARQLAFDSGDQPAMVMAMLYLTDVYRNTGDLDSAVEYYNQYRALGGDTEIDFD